MDDIDAIAVRNKARTQGTWRWFGFASNQNIYLATQEFGRNSIMTFARWGMQAAQPLFRRERVLCGVKDLITSGEIQCDHNTEIYGVTHPDMAFIQHAPDDVTTLLDMVRKLQPIVEAAKRVVFDAQDIVDKPHKLWNGLRILALALGDKEAAKRCDVIYNTSPKVVADVRNTENERLRELYFIRHRAEQAWMNSGESSNTLYGLMVDANMAYHDFAATLEETK